MKSIQVAQLKTNFSAILQQVENKGEKFIIAYGKKHKKIAMIIPYDARLEDTQPRTFGLLQNKGSFKIEDDFAISDDEFLGL